MTLEDRDGRDGVTSAFLELPWAVYADDPNWIPEDPHSVRSAFSTANSWFARGAARTFCIAGRARAAVFVDPACRVAERRAAFFGFWESAGDDDADAAVLGAAADWARARGAAMLYGPVDFTTFGRYRLRVEAEESARPFLGEPYNPRSYPARLERLGFAAARHYVTQRADALQEDVLDAKRAARERLLSDGFRIEPLTGERWCALLPELHALADAIFGDAFAYTPIPFSAFASGYGVIVAAQLCPRTSLVATAPDGSTAGVLLVFPDYAPLLLRSAGAARLSPSMLRFADHAARLANAGERTAIMKTVGVARAWRRRGLMDALLVTSVDRGRPQYDRWLGALIRDDNPSRRFGAPHAGAERRYTLYGRSLEPGAPDAAR